MQDLERLGGLFGCGKARRGEQAQQKHEMDWVDEHDSESDEKHHENMIKYIGDTKAKQERR